MFSDKVCFAVTSDYGHQVFPYFHILWKERRRHYARQNVHERDHYGQSVMVCATRKTLCTMAEYRFIALSGVWVKSSTGHFVDTTSSTGSFRRQAVSSTCYFVKKYVYLNL